MVFDFDKMNETVNERFKGGEKAMYSRAFSDNLNKIMRNVLPVGGSVGYHKHETNSEIIFIISGEAKCLYDDGEEYLLPGQCHYCPMDHSHSLINISPTDELVFFAVVPEHK